MNNREFDSKTKYDREKRFRKQVCNRKNRKCKKGQIVLLGDSITEFFDVALLDGKSSLEIYNRGISGDTSNRLLERLDENVLSIAPAQIFLLIGTNDFNMGADADYVFGNIKTIAEKIKAALPGCRLVIECIFPINPKYYDCEKTRNENVAKTNEMLREYAKDGGFTLLDLTDFLSDDDGFFSKEYSDDGLHPSPNGNAALAEKLSESLL